MMKKLQLITALILLLPFTICANNDGESFFKKIDKRFNLSSVRKMDTNYYTIAKNGWMVNMNNNFAGYFLTLKNDGTPSYGDVKLKVHTRFNYQVSSTFGYRNLILGVSLVNVSNNIKDFTLSLSANTWGVEFRRLSGSNIGGQLQTSALGEDIDIKNGDMDVKKIYLRNYFVFNSRKYSTTAAIDQRCIQKKSAGSLLFYADYSYNTVKLHNNQIRIRFNNIKAIEFSQAELGLGYGYNFTPNQGKFLLHASVIPMFAAINSNYIDDGSLQSQDTKNKYFFNCMGRITANYRFNDTFGICLSAFLNTNRMSLKQDISLNMYDYLLKASLCFRF